MLTKKKKIVEIEEVEGNRGGRKNNPEKEHERRKTNDKNET